MCNQISRTYFILFDIQFSFSVFALNKILFFSHVVDYVAMVARVKMRSLDQQLVLSEWLVRIR